MMNLVLWIIQGLLAFMFLFAGATKLLKSKTELKEKLGDWVDDYSSSNVKMIGLVEVLGAIGLFLPMLINVLPILTPIAAAGLAITMIGAALLHKKRNENDKVIMNIVLFLLAACVVVGRLYILPVF